MSQNDETYAPGRKVMKRASGVHDVYWVAKPAAVRAGYTPRTVRLTDDPGEASASVAVAARCRRMWAEMLEFLAGRTCGPRTGPAGTLGWIIDLYQTDPESPFHSKKPVTKDGYDKSLAIIRGTVGGRRIDALDGDDVRRWFKLWGRADATGQLANPRRAYGCIQLLRIVMKYGKSRRNAACREMADILSDMEFPAPKGRGVAMSGAQAIAIIAKAKNAGEFGIARAVALQYGCGLRQKDVIGEWLRDGRDGRRWSTGLLWGEHVSADLVLRKPTSKSKGAEIAEHDLRLIPIAFCEIEAIPRERRIGPVILDDRSGRPFVQREFARRFREVARLAGVPDGVWNMDARAGAITDAHEKGARIEDAMAAATHRQMATNLGYRRSKLDATSRVARLRFGENGGGTKGE